MTLTMTAPATQSVQAGAVYCSMTIVGTGFCTLGRERASSFILLEDCGEGCAPNVNFEIPVEVLQSVF